MEAFERREQLLDEHFRGAGGIEKAMRVEILPSARQGLARIKYRVQADFGEDVALNVPDPWLNDMGFRMVICNRRSVSIFRKAGESIFVYIIADTRTEYTRVFRDNSYFDSGNFQEFCC